MLRASTVFIACCMTLIAASLGAILYYMLGLDLTQAGLFALAVLTLLILYNAIAMRLRNRSDVGGQIADLSRGTADLARQMAEFGRRLAAVEGKMAAAPQPPAAANGVVDEIAELGGIINQLAMTVATHEEKLAGAAPSPAGQASAPLRAGGAPQSIPMPTGITADAVRAAVDANRLDLYLQPLVTLPQRKVRYYEAVCRLRDSDGDVLAAADFLPAAEQGRLMPRIDHMVIFRCVQVLRRLMVKTKDIGLFCNLSRQTFSDEAIFQQCLDFLDANKALAPALVFELMQASLRNLTPLETEHMAALAQRGFRFSIDHVTDLRIDPRELADRGVKFVKIPAPLLLDQKKTGALDIHPADLSDLLGRFGIDLVAEKIEGESSVVDLLDYDVRYGQGFLFSPPRPLRLDGASDTASTAGPTGAFASARPA